MLAVGKPRINLMQTNAKIRRGAINWMLAILHGRRDLEQILKGRLKLDQLEISHCS